MKFIDFKSELKDEFGIPEYKAKEMLIHLQAKMREQLLFGVQLNIYGVGKIETVVSPAKRFLNLQTGEVEQNQKHFKLKFKPAPSLAKEVKRKIIS